MSGHVRKHLYTDCMKKNQFDFILHFSEHSVRIRRSKKRSTGNQPLGYVHTVSFSKRFHVFSNPLRTENNIKHYGKRHRVHIVLVCMQYRRGN